MDDNTLRGENCPAYGSVTEWFKVTVLKIVDGDEPSVGSNPTTTANPIRVGKEASTRCCLLR